MEGGIWEEEMQNIMGERSFNVSKTLAPLLPQRARVAFVLCPLTAVYSVVRWPLVLVKK